MIPPTFVQQRYQEELAAFWARQGTLKAQSVEDGWWTPPYSLKDFNRDLAAAADKHLIPMVERKSLLFAAFFPETA